MAAPRGCHLSPVASWLLYSVGLSKDTPKDFFFLSAPKLPWGISRQDLKPIRPWPPSRVAQVTPGTGHTRCFLLSHPRDAAPGITPCPGRRQQSWSCSGRGKGTISVPCTSQPPCRARFSIPGTQRGLSSACSDRESGQALGPVCPSLQGESFFQAMIFFAFPPLTEATQEPCRSQGCLVLPGALERTLLPALNRCRSSA